MNHEHSNQRASSLIQCGHGARMSDSRIIDQPSLQDVVIDRIADDPQFWLSWDGGMYEFAGRDRNNDPIMVSIDGKQNKCISGRALNRTWHPKWKSLCCDRWLNYEPVKEVACFHSGPNR